MATQMSPKQTRKATKAELVRRKANAKLNGWDYFEVENLTDDDKIIVKSLGWTYEELADSKFRIKWPSWA